MFAVRITSSPQTKNTTQPLTVSLHLNSKTNTMKKLLLISAAVLTLTVAHGQTNVSGGIFSNTTWTKVNSPYIVIDTVVVFPGVTLTIQPGVTVKFANNKRIEIRQAKIIAVGTTVDSITFTSNSSSPAPGIYSGLYLNGGTFTSQFNYCNFYYADKGINHYLVQDTVIVKNSNFKFNKYGIKDDWQFYDLLSKIDSCNFMDNTIDGLFVIGVVTNCNISYKLNIISNPCHLRSYSVGPKKGGENKWRGNNYTNHYK